jgi:hypothetical protein
MKSLSLKSGTGQEYPSPLLFNSLGIPGYSNREKKEIKGIQIEKEEVKLSLLTDNMILLKDPKDSTQKNTPRSH